MEDHELESLLVDLESDRVERKESISEKNKIRQAICAFANDMPNHRQPGVLFIGVKDNGECANLAITDELLRTLSDIRSDGNILPMPTITVEKLTLNACTMAVVIVEPSYDPPVRFNGRVWIRVGPRRATATVEEEKRLSERRRAGDLPYDLQPVRSATIEDLDIDLFQRTYLPSAIDPDILAANNRQVEDQLRSLRFLSARELLPTVVGLLTLGKSPADYVPGAYVQFLRLEGEQLTDDIADQRVIQGPLPELLRQLDEIIKANIHISTDIRSENREVRRPDYPIAAIQQIARNAVMHRNYETSNAPVRLNWFSDRVEIQNPGGPYGQVTRDNFGEIGLTDYRNPTVAEVMWILGFVQRFGVGIQLARKELKNNGNPDLEFNVQDNHILAIIRRRP